MSFPITPRLVITDALGRRVVPLDKPTVTLGRRADIDVRVVGSGVSRLHAEIRTDQGISRLHDCGSTFGTFVNGERISECVLTHGDRLALGQADETDIRFTIDEGSTSEERSSADAVGEVRQLAVLLEGLRSLGSGRVLDDVLAMVIDAAIEVTGAERGFIMLSQTGGQLEFKLARLQGHQTLSGETFATSRKIPDQVFTTGRVAIVEDLLEHNPAGEHAHTAALGIRSVLCTPLRLVRYLERADDSTEDTVIGVLYLDSQQPGALRSAAVRSALDALSTEAAVAIENARLYREALARARLEQELTVAAAIQQALLPVAARTGTFFTTAGTSVPCQSVGGDFFDYVDLPTGGFGFIVGDVAGKGPAAALLSAALVGMFSAEATHQPSAATVLDRLNRGLLRRGIDARFVTAFYGTLAPDGTLTYANGGHTAPVLMTAQGVRRLDRGGMVLGLFSDADFEQETIALRPGDIVVVSSDGVSKALDTAGEEFTDRRLLASIDLPHSRSPQALLDGLLADLRTFCGEVKANDDVTIVIVRYDGPR